MVRSAITDEWKVAFAAALLGEGEETAAQMDLAAAKFDENPATRGIANLLRDRADDLRRVSAEDRELWQAGL